MISAMKRNLLLVLLATVALAAEIQRSAPEFDQIVPSGATVEKLAGNFKFTEGPVWIHAGYLLFSDIPANAIMKWTPAGEVSVFLKPSGFTGTGAPEGALVGSNGLTLDHQGRLIICQHGDRQVVRREKNGSLSVLAAKYEGKRLNSPNDVVVKKDGSIWFTDPPYGLPKQDDDPAKELKFSGVYRLAGGKLRLVYQDLARPNGIAFSPDEKVLYVGNSDQAKKIWMRFDVKTDGSISGGKLFYDVTSETAPGVPDGMKVDTKGNLYCTGPGGIWVFSAEGKHLGNIDPPEVPANLAWGDADGKTMYITARTGLYRIRLNIAGVRP
jgi:gluconolactonase